MSVVALPVETKTRELDGKLFLALNLIERGHCVYIGPDYEILRSIDIIQPDIYISKDTPQDNNEFLTELSHSGVSVCILETEGGVFDSLEDYLQGKQGIMNRYDAFFAWGPKQAEAIGQCNSDVSGIHVTGNPRFDLLRPRLREIYKQRSKSIIEQYGDYILINGPFGRFNMFPDHGREKDDYQLFRELIRLIYELSDEFQGFNIIVRPHPSEDHSRYKREFNQSDNVITEYSGDVRTWISGASMTIFHRSTTGIEAALMGTPAISYRPLEDDNSESIITQEIAKNAFTREDILDILHEYAQDDLSFSLTTGEKEKLSNYFYRGDQTSAAKICKVIDSINTDARAQYQFTQPAIMRVKRLLKSSRLSDEILIIRDMIYRILNRDSAVIQRQYGEQKFPGLGRNELSNKISELSNKTTCTDVNIENVKLTNYTYSLQTISD
jgi:surface carbohydrate biosynthesis protein